jgi:hypothetical protein
MYIHAYMTTLYMNYHSYQIMLRMKYFYDWGEGKTNIPNSRDDAPLASPHPVSLDPAEGGQ